MLHLVRGIDALCDVGRLLVERNDDAAGGRVEAPLGMRVADLGDPLAHELGNVDVDLRRDLARDDHEPGRDQRLAGDAALRILGQNGIEDGIRDLVGDLVGMPLGDGFRGEQELAGGHGATGYTERLTT